MRYQQYKNRMLKIRKVIDFFYRFRFVFAGIIVAIIAGSITLDVSKGSITETTQFQMSYVYGEEITYSGSAFMGTVTYEFRKKVMRSGLRNSPQSLANMKQEQNR